MEIHCRACIFSSIEKEQLQKNIDDYINSLSPEEKAGERLYKERLRLCFRCPNCFDGLCRICGCFVSARAAKAKAYCPKSDKIW